MTDLHSLFVNEAPFAIAVLSTPGTILSWNNTAEAIFGFTSQEAIGSSIHSLIVPKPYQEESKKALHLALQNGSFVYESIRTTKKGYDLTVEVYLSAHVYEEGTVVFNTIRVLSEQQRLEQLRRKNASETTAFLSNMSHELRTPLNSIVGFTEFLLEDKSGSLSTKQVAYLRDVLASGKQLLNLINTLLDLAKLDSGKFSIAPEEFEVKSTAQQIISLFTAIASEHKVQLRTDIEEECIVNLDPHKFKQVLYNLLSNAIKFTDSGGRIDTVIRKAGGDHLELVITNTGMAGSENGDREEGLGLLLTKKILELQNGSFAVENTVNSGTSFIVTLPISYPVFREAP